MGSFSQDHYKILFLLVGIVAIYILPTLVAVIFENPQKRKIVIINLLLGWTLIGWVVSLIMAFKKSVNSEEIV